MSGFSMVYMNPLGLDSVSAKAFATIKITDLRLKRKSVPHHSASVRFERDHAVTLSSSLFLVFLRNN